MIPMKRFRYNISVFPRFVALVAALMTMALPMTVSAKEIFADLAGMNMVESTYISGRFAHNMRQWRSARGNHVMNLDQGFSSMYTYQCYSVEAVEKAGKILKAYLKANPDIEEVLRTNDASGAYQIFERFDSEDRLMQMIIWNNEAPNVCEIVVIDWKDGLKRDVSSCGSEYFLLDFDWGVMTYLPGMSGVINMTD